MVRIRPVAIAWAVPMASDSSADGTISRVIPGGCTSTNEPYGRKPWIRLTALPK